MKNFFGSVFGRVLMSLLVLGCVVTCAWADVDPSRQSDSDSSSLRQFPQMETAALPAASAPQAQAPMETVANPNSSGIDFPKVVTPDDEKMAKKFSWWPSDAKPAPYKDPSRSGFWWWPDQPGQSQNGPWGNQGFIYVRKVIFDYKSAEGVEKPSLIIKRIIKNVKVFFDFDKSNIRDDASEILSRALSTMRDNPKADILITGSADVRGSEKYNMKLGERRADSVKQFLLDKGLLEERIKILSRGKLDALAPTGDLVGMQKDRNAQFMIAEVEEVMIPASQAHLFKDKTIEEEERLEGEIKVDTKDYVIQSGDTLWGIAKREYGDGKQWKRIYEFNKEALPNPDRPRKGTKIKIPIE